MSLQSEHFWKAQKSWVINFRYDNTDDDNFSQPKLFYQKILGKAAQDRMIKNIVDHLSNAADFIQERQVKLFKQVDQTFGDRVAQGLNIIKKTKANL